MDLDSDKDGISDRDEAGLSLNDSDRDRVDNLFDVDFTKGQDKNGDGIDDNITLSDTNKNGVADFLDKGVRVARTTLVNSVEKLAAKPVISKPSAKLPLKASAEGEVKSLAEVAVKAKTKIKEPVVAKLESKPVVEKSPNLEVAKLKTPKSILINDDADGDGIPDAIELALGMNPMSSDSDADGIPDFIEIGNNNKSPQDSDQDGTPDALDTDDDNDGILTKLEDVDKNGQLFNDDTDKDGVPNYLDANDDGDSRLTKYEGKEKDTDKDGIPDYLDSADGVSSEGQAEVVVLYDESDKSNRSVKSPPVSFDLVTKSSQVQK